MYCRCSHCLYSRRNPEELTLLADPAIVDNYVASLEDLATPSRDSYYRSRLPLLLQQMYEKGLDIDFASNQFKDLLYMAVVDRDIELAIAAINDREEDLLDPMDVVSINREYGKLDLELPNCLVKDRKGWVQIKRDTFAQSKIAKDAILSLFGMGTPTTIRAYVNIDGAAFNADAFMRFLTWACINLDSSMTFKFPSKEYASGFLMRHDNTVFYCRGSCNNDAFVEHVMDIADALVDSGVVLNQNPTPIYFQINKPRKSFHSHLVSLMQEVLIAIEAETSSFESLIDEIIIALSTDGIFTEHLVQQGYVL